jgi:hypothetical protein
MSTEFIVVGIILIFAVPTLIGLHISNKNNRIIKEEEIKKVLHHHNRTKSANPHHVGIRRNRNWNEESARYKVDDSVNLHNTLLYTAMIDLDNDKPSKSYHSSSHDSDSGYSSYDSGSSDSGSSSSSSSSGSD